jgi:hypothetical protein
MDDVIEYIKKKREFTKKDYKLRFIFENTIIKENEELYLKKVIKMEEKMVNDSISPKKMQDFFKISCKKTWRKEKKQGMAPTHLTMG